MNRSAGALLGFVVLVSLLGAPRVLATGFGVFELPPFGCTLDCPITAGDGIPVRELRDGEILIEGYVVDRLSRPLPGIIVYPVAGSAIVGGPDTLQSLPERFTFTDRNGLFSIIVDRERSDRIVAACVFEFRNGSVKVLHTLSALPRAFVDVATRRLRLDLPRRRGGCVEPIRPFASPGGPRN